MLPTGFLREKKNLCFPCQPNKVLADSYYCSHVHHEFQEHLEIMGSSHSRVGAKTVDPSEDVCDPSTASLLS